ncbi:hypothetical protein BJ508DRAFT_220671 [Ascobolus immersus RN42]|uniref:Nop52-domain-containing protein n=1 Tax=Ascobolus immersus RN42 TaxID=1160509 RepID=A0A3N4J0E3_ASCIM|nr:hypothetical protein BJ508DRAFT_220671 [Ascobolus immersus RN42]
MAPKLPRPIEEPSANSPFIKQLAANDRATRDAAVNSLRMFLAMDRPFSRLDLLKLWKGLYFTMWFSDRPIPQQQLAQTLADLVSAVKEQNVHLFLDAFWETMSREWENIDSHRLDKFLLLIRRYVFAHFAYLERANYSQDAFDAVISALVAVPLDATNRRIPDGLRLHVLDVYVDELERSLDSGKEKGKEFSDTKKSIVKKLLEPVERLEKETQAKVVRKRVRDTLSDSRLKVWLGIKDEPAAEEEEEEEWQGIQDD